MKNRLWLSLGTIFATLALVSGVAYAYFTSNAAVMNGVTLASATPLLTISTDGEDYSVDPITGDSESYLYPGWIGAERKFFLKNESGGGVPFSQVIPVVSAGGDWDDLKDSIQVRFGETGSTWTTGWTSLADWDANTTIGILSTNLIDGTSRQISLQYQLPNTVGDEAKGKTISGLQWDLVARTP
jgi:hypothetical protein